MAKFIIEADAKYETIRALLPASFPVTVEKELVTCRNCKYSIQIEPFPHPYCEARLFGKAVDPEFFCADGERK